jgi:ubiquinone/menaquinone biosynthesis C-methylase UbiE
VKKAKMMSQTRIMNQDFLRKDQYHSSDNLDARIQVHEHFSINKTGWSKWVFDQIDLRPGMKILEIGCGMGSLWRENYARIPENISITLGDLSIGMVLETQQVLKGDKRFSFAVIDAQDLPLQTGTYDLVLANHMLYHVPNIQMALKEVRRLLRPGGRFSAATNGPGHMRQINDLINEVIEKPILYQDSVQRFGLGNGASILEKFFPKIVTRIYPDALFITEAQPLFAYIASMWTYKEAVDEDHGRLLQQIIEKHIWWMVGFISKNRLGYLFVPEANLPNQNEISRGCFFSRMPEPVQGERQSPKSDHLGILLRSRH